MKGYIGKEDQPSDLICFECDHEKRVHSINGCSACQRIGRNCRIPDIPKPIRIIEHGSVRKDSIAIENPNLLITVCSECLQASCWQGKFFCEKAITAGTKQLTRNQLTELNTGEHPDYWKSDLEISVQ